MTAPLGKHSRIVDPADRADLEARIARRMAVTTPQVGDFIDYANGVTRRIAFVWSEGVQSAMDQPGMSVPSFQMLSTGELSYSGGLHLATPTANLTDTGEFRPGVAWIFSRGVIAAGNGVDFNAPCRVWASTDDAPE